MVTREIGTNHMHVKLYLDKSFTILQSKLNNSSDPEAMPVHMPMGECIAALVVHSS